MSAIVSREWQALSEPLRAARSARGLDAAWAWTVGQAPRFMPRRALLARQAGRVMERIDALEHLNDAALRTVAMEQRRGILRAGNARAELTEAFAVVCEATRRRLGLRPHREQIIGALALDAGCIAEMATGEGKTITAAIAATVAGWRGRGVHIITVNDYLANRDAQWMRPVFEFCGVTVGAITAESSGADRRIAYAQDVTYCTNKEAAADFLRDRLRLGNRAGGGALAQELVQRISDVAGNPVRPLVQRGLACAIVDEADSVLIDEAVTPLIIAASGPGAEHDATYTAAARVARELSAGRDYHVDRARREVSLSETGRGRIAALWTGSEAPVGARRCEELIVQALVAMEHYALGKHYVVQDGRVVIVDEFTGRLMADRTWRDGMHQAIEAKESLAIRSAQGTLAQISFQRFFRLYRRLSGMTGTAREASGELWRVYALPVVRVPTHRPVARVRAAERIFGRERDKWTAIVEEIGRLRSLGRPTLVGVRSVAAGEHMSGLLGERGVSHAVLSAVRHDAEAQVIAGAGEAGTVTVATNMAGRGTDIRLGEGVAEAGGLAVIATERHESRRIDRQLFGRAGRQGDPGSGQAIISLEDELVVRYAPRLAAALRRAARGSELQGPMFRAAARVVFAIAERRAVKAARRMRASVLRSDDWLDDSLGFAGKGV